MKRNQNGFSVLELLLVIVILGAVGFLGWKAYSNMKANKEGSTSSVSKSKSTQASKFIWQQTQSGWQATEEAPDCPAQPMLTSPADLSKATSILYPGQTRGAYKPHGGMRFDNSTDNVIKVTSPMDGFIVKGTRFIAEGEIQYSFDVMNNCGVMYRIGHLREIPGNLLKIADTWPEASADSRHHRVEPAVAISTGDVIGSKVGIIGSKNTFFDFGVYDYRKENEASKSSAYQAAHQQDKEQSWHAVCWLKDWLPASQTAQINALAVKASASSKQSDYCS